MLRTDSDIKIKNFKRYMTIPLINGLSPFSHPTQILSDIFTVEKLKNLFQNYVLPGLVTQTMF